MRWSDCMKLSDVREYKEYLSGCPGVYEIGHVRGEWFYPKYVGKASLTAKSDLFSRLKSYTYPSSRNNAHVVHRLRSEYNNVWFHVLRITDEVWTESRLQVIFGIKGDGLYEWNKKEESAFKNRVCKR